MQYLDIKQYYDDRYRAQTDSAFDYDEARTRAQLAPLLDHVPAGSRILDVGCGVGYACAFLDKRGDRVSGIDISDEALALARARVPNGSFYLAREDGSLPFVPGSFDGIACLGVLEHLPDPSQLLRECARVLRDGGVAAFVVPNARSPYFFAGRGTGQVYEQPRTRAEWERLFRAAGLEPISVTRDPGPRISRRQTLRRNAKLFVHRVINHLPVALTYQFVFDLRKR